MTRLTRRDLLIASSAVVAAAALPSARFVAAAMPESSGLPDNSNTKGERSMTTITTKDGTQIWGEPLG